jgi:hypothetical protein
MNPGAGFHQMPFGWSQGRLTDVASIDSANRTKEVRNILAHAFWGNHTLFLNWLAVNLNTERPIFERTAIAQDIEELEEFFEQQQRPGKKSEQMALL